MVFLYNIVLVIDYYSYYLTVHLLVYIRSYWSDVLPCLVLVFAIV